MKNYQKYFSIGCLCIGGGGASCEKHNREAEKKTFYTYNRHRLGKYTPLEAQQLLQKCPFEDHQIAHIRKKDRIKKWCTTGTEPKPHELFEAYERTCLTKLLNQYPTLAHYCDQWKIFLKDPTETNEKKLKEAIEACNKDKNAKDALTGDATRLYTHPTDTYLTEVWLAYQECLYFLLNDDSDNRLHCTLRECHSNLATWEKEGYPSGLTLWGSIKPFCAQHECLKEAPENYQAIENALQITERLAKTPYGLTYTEWQETLPNGLDLLNNILDDRSFKKKKDKDEAVVQLRNYLKCIPISLE